AAHLRANYTPRNPTEKSGRPPRPLGAAGVARPPLRPRIPAAAVRGTRPAAGAAARRRRTDRRKPEPAGGYKRFPPGAAAARHSPPGERSAAARRPPQDKRGGGARRGDVAHLDSGADRTNRPVAYRSSRSGAR